MIMMFVESFFQNLDSTLATFVELVEQRSKDDMTQSAMYCHIAKRSFRVLRKTAFKSRKTHTVYFHILRRIHFVHVQLHSLSTLN